MYPCNCHNVYRAPIFLHCFRKCDHQNGCHTVLLIDMIHNEALNNSRPEMPYKNIHRMLKVTGFPGGSDGKESPCNVGDLG